MAFFNENGFLTIFRKRVPPIGSHPGTLVPAPGDYQPRITVIDYSADSVEETAISDVELLLRYKDSPSVTWVDVQGLGDAALLLRIGEIFSLHPLTVADIANIPTRPKVEEHDDYLLIISSGAEMLPGMQLKTEQISIVLGKHIVLTFQERYGDNFDAIRNRIRQKQGSIRRAGTDYLACAVLDAIIDSHYPALEALGDYLEELEDEVLDNPTREVLSRVYRVRRELLGLRRSIWPQREVLNFLIREEHKLLKKPVRIYFRDIYDHCVQIIDVTETFREMCSDLTDVYLSGMSNRLNEVMKVLTVISTIFIPLSFLASVYGMNFHYLPELTYHWAYPVFWIVVLAAAGTMLIVFRRRGWI